MKCAVFETHPRNRTNETPMAIQCLLSDPTVFLDESLEAVDCELGFLKFRVFQVGRSIN